MKFCLKCSNPFLRDEWSCPACNWQPARLGGRLAFAPDFAQQDPGFASHYFEDLAQQEEGHFWFESRNRIILWMLRTYFPQMTNFLEIGCGTGFVLSSVQRSFPGLAISGSEIFPQGLQFASERLLSASLFQMDARHVPFQEEWDVIGAFDVLEHIDEDEAVLAEMFRATKTGGGIVLTVPQHPWLWSAVDEYAFHKRRYTRAELVRKVEAAGFRILRLTSFITLLLPLLVISRFRKQVVDDRELRISRTVNNALLAVLGLERRLAQVFSLPVGGSLLLAAVKP